MVKGVIGGGMEGGVERSIVEVVRQRERGWNGRRYFFRAGMTYISI